MDRSTPVYLIPRRYTQNAGGEFIQDAEPRMVFANLRSVTRAEFSAAGALGLRPEYVATMFAPDYELEDTVQIELDGQLWQFAIYRTYRNADESLELYLGDRVGVTEGPVFGEA